MLRRLGSETALPQNARFSDVSCGKPSDRTSVDVSLRAQQNDCHGSVSRGPLRAFKDLRYNLPDRVP